MPIGKDNPQGDDRSIAYRENNTSKPRDLRVLNLGAGVQSTTIALMMHVGEIEPADVAIFADTGWEPKAVYDHLDGLERLISLSVPIHRVSRGNLREDFLNEDAEWVSAIPLFVKKEEERRGRGRRFCTTDYKIFPVEREIRNILGVKSLRGKHIQQVFGISLDESQRMRDPRTKWATYDYPLIDMGMTRDNCFEWMENAGFPRPPRSACIGCPFHNDSEWINMKKHDPESWADAVEFDAAIRGGAPSIARKGTPLDGVGYLHSSLVPLPEVEFNENSVNEWEGECLGLCGV